ncbi:MAG: hypothetical protein GY928_13195 [Colwellia sp.]|nr:hypothetical protein [Colwellia sp.]
MANDLDNIIRLQKALESLIAKASPSDNVNVVEKGEDTEQPITPEVVEDTPQPEEDNNTVETAGQMLNEHSDDEMRALEVIMEVDKKDQHGNFYSAETLEGADASYKKNDVPSNLFHIVDTDGFEMEETFILEEDTHYEAIGETIKKGAWMGWTKFNDTELWELKKSNELGGLSPKCLGNVNADTGEITNLAFSKEDLLAYGDDSE